MKPLTLDILKALDRPQALFFDIDDTFSTEGKIKSNAFEALWKLVDQNFICVPVTGRPAGWCDHIARFWPVHAVVGENGAFSMYLDSERRLRRLETPFDLTPKAAHFKLEALRSELTQQFPFIQFASDQNYREFDLAIDYCEDVPAWDSERIRSVMQVCASKGAQVKLSSIHINTWFGNYSKREGIEALLGASEQILGESIEIQRCLYIGDSPNDAPLFDFFPHSVAVNNYRAFQHQSEFQPKYILSQNAGDGFCELAKHLLSL